MTRLFILVGVFGICGGMTFANVSAVTPIFYSSLDDEASSITNNPFNGAGSTPNDNFTFVPSPIAGHRNAFQGNGGGYARWNDASVSTIFSSWNNNNGITIDHYFQGAWAGVTGLENEGMWAMVRRHNGAGQLGDTYLFTSIQTGKLRIAFANASTEQYKFTFNGAPANPGASEYADGVNIPLIDNTPFHLTVSIGDGEFKVWLDDVNGELYSNDSPIYTYSLPTGYDWQLPPSGAVPSSGSGGRLTREMDIGIRGAGSNFGGTLLDDTWVDEVNIYNGIYSPADLIEEPPIGLDGDHNEDGTVDAADYVAWRKLDIDGPTGYSDFVEHFGEPGSGGASQSGPVPEPSMAALVTCACFAFAMRRSHSVSGRRSRSM